MWLVFDKKIVFLLSLNFFILVYPMAASMYLIGISRTCESQKSKELVSNIWEHRAFFCSPEMQSKSITCSIVLKSSKLEKSLWCSLEIIDIFYIKHDFKYVLRNHWYQNVHIVEKISSWQITVILLQTIHGIHFK